MMKKRAIGMELVGLILVLVFIAGGFGITSKLFGGRLDEDVINTHCRESVLFNAERRVPGIDIQTVDVNCPTKYITIHKDSAEMEYEQGGKEEQKPIQLPETVFRDDKKSCADSDDDDACIFRNTNKIIANELARCWSNFHQGQRRVFSEFRDDQTQCVVCSVILFDNEMIEKYGNDGLIGLENPEDEDYSLDLYMRRNNNLKYTGEDNYYHFTLDLVDEYFELPYYDYEVNREYAVVFAALNKGSIQGITEDAWELIKSIFTDYVPEEENQGNFINTLHFIPNEEVPAICDTFA